MNIRWNANSAYAITSWQGTRLYASSCKDAFYRCEPEPLINAVVSTLYEVDDYSNRYTLYVFGSAMKQDTQGLPTITAEGGGRSWGDIDLPADWRNALSLGHTSMHCTFIKYFESYGLDMICGKPVGNHCASGAQNIH